MTSANARATAVLVQAAPVLLGVPLYVAAFSLAGMLVYFVPGVFMAIAGLLAAGIARAFAPPGFVRNAAAGSLRFHGIVTIVALVVLALVYTALFAGGYMAATGAGAMLLGVLLPLVELGRSLMYGVAAARGRQG